MARRPDVLTKTKGKTATISTLRSDWGREDMLGN